MFSIMTRHKTLVIECPKCHKQHVVNNGISPVFCAHCADLMPDIFEMSNMPLKRLFYHFYKDFFE